jgi:ABC-type dipeptide/oligopeptide/nickel transport system permease component
MRFVKILERILATIPVMIGVAILAFAFMRLTPGDPVDLMMGEAGVVSKAEIQAIRSNSNWTNPSTSNFFPISQGS